MNLSECAIVIPIYKENPTEIEKSSLIQCCKVLGKHNFSLVCPSSLNVDAYIAVLKEYGIKFGVVEFDRQYFTGIRGYNLLMLNADFYTRFAKYDFMLIYQLDAWVFGDDLDYWCDQGFDFIGAPWRRFDFLRNRLHILESGVNGGFSLRKIGSFINILNVSGNDKKILDRYLLGGRNEDGFFSTYAAKIDHSFKVAPSDVAMRFSFEQKPAELFRLMGNALPFGCHAWRKYDPIFWSEFIKI